MNATILVSQHPDDTNKISVATALRTGTGAQDTRVVDMEEIEAPDATKVSEYSTRMGKKHTGYTFASNPVSFESLSYTTRITIASWMGNGYTRYLGNYTDNVSALFILSLIAARVDIDKAGSEVLPFVELEAPLRRKCRVDNRQVHFERNEDGDEGIEDGDITAPLFLRMLGFMVAEGLTPA